MNLVPTQIPEWEAEDELTAELSGEKLEEVDESIAKKMLEKNKIDLPPACDWKDLRKYNEQKKTPLKLDIPPDNDKFDFYLLEIPVGILIAKGYLYRLRVALDLKTGNSNKEQTVAYDLFPTDKTEVRTIMKGDLKLDVSKLLNFILTATGLGGFSSAAEVFELPLTLPIKWNTTSAKIRTSDRMSNPVEWYVTDKNIQNGFTGHVIIRAPKHSGVTVNATLSCELREPAWKGIIHKSRYMSAEPQSYELIPSTVV